MASLLGEGGLGLLSGTASAATPVTLVDFRPSSGNAISNGADGRAVNAYTVHNGDTTGLYLVRGRVDGLQENNTASAFTIWPGLDKTFQIGLNRNELTRITAWATDMSGNTFSGSITISGEPLSRRV